MAASPECLIFAVNRTIDMTNLGSNPREPYSQSYALSKRGLLLPEQWSSVHIEVFYREEKLGVSDS
jgi:hypothetical protein